MVKKRREKDGREEKGERKRRRVTNKGQRMYKREPYQPKNTSSVFIWVSIFPFISNLIAY